MKHETGHLTKAYEKAMFDRMVKETPDGYVKTILADIQLEVERAIDSDFGFITFSDRMHEMESHRTAMENARAELAKVKANIAELGYREITLTSGLEGMRREISKFSGLVHQLAKL